MSFSSLQVFADYHSKHGTFHNVSQAFPDINCPVCLDFVNSSVSNPECLLPAVCNHCGAVRTPESTRFYAQLSCYFLCSDFCSDLSSVISLIDSFPSVHGLAAVRVQLLLLLNLYNSKRGVNHVNS